MTTADWPATMPNPADDPGRTQAAGLLAQVSKDTPPLKETLRSSDLPTAAVKAAGEAFGAIGSVHKHVNTTLAQLDAHTSNDLIPDKGRRRLATEARQAGARALAEARTKADGATSLLEAALLDAATPTFPAGADREEARQELRMLLDGADDPAALIVELAAGTDQRLAALAAGTFGASALRARGVPEDTIDATRTMAAAAATTSTDPARRAAAAALQKLPELRKLSGAAFGAAAMALPEQD